MLQRDLKNDDHASPGSGYGRPPGTFDEALVRVGPGTPGGEMLRRYWWPIAASDEVKDLPRKVRLLGEDFILFRDKSGKAGLLYPRCIHRGTTLFYGRVEEDGIRCCYHGWLFDAEGRVLEMPCEPNAGAEIRQRYRQPWHPVEERYGVVFAYIGPPEEKPPLPRYDLLEDLENGAYELFVDPHHFIASDPEVAPYNWVQKSENTMDPWHVYILHSNMARSQFHEFFRFRPKVTWEYTDIGVRCCSERVAEGNVIHRVNDLVFPALAVIGNPLAHEFDRSVVFNFFVPVDDETCTDMIIFRAKPDIIAKARTGAYARELMPKLWSEMSVEEHQRDPHDFEAQLGQGAITLHSEENLVSSDTGVSMYRRMLRKAMKDVAEGRAPFNARLDSSGPELKLRGGNYMIGPAPSE
ncbi:MAG: Rieske 2Fe-2S domain-containing protein [Hyphomonadaceae bacterium]